MIIELIILYSNKYKEIHPNESKEIDELTDLICNELLKSNEL